MRMLQLLLTVADDAPKKKEIKGRINMNTNTKTRTVLIAWGALVVGAAIGVAGTKLGHGDLPLSNNPNSPGSAGRQDPSPTPNQWDPFQEIQRMQAQMDQSFNQMFEQLRTQPQFSGAFPGNPNYSSSLNVQDFKNCYEVRVFLPDAKSSNAHVTLNGQTLKVEVNSGQSSSLNQTNQLSQVSQWGQYDQVIQLPGPVNASKMTIKHEGHDLIIRVPKAG